jgi:hypothetical protein
LIRVKVREQKFGVIERDPLRRYRKKQTGVIDYPSVKRGES